MTKAKDKAPKAQDSAADQSPAEPHTYATEKPASPHHLPNTEHDKINEIDSFLSLPPAEAIAAVEAITTSFNGNAVEEYRQSVLTWLRNE